MMHLPCFVYIVVVTVASYSCFDSFLLRSRSFSGSVGAVVVVLPTGAPAGVHYGLLPLRCFFINYLSLYCTMYVCAEMWSNFLYYLAVM
jgi:hypothetical protein